MTIKQRNLWAMAVWVMLLLSAVVLQLGNAKREAKAASGEGPGPGSVPNHYPLDKQTTAYRTTISAIDSTTINSTFATDVTTFDLNGRRNVSVSARFSTASATVGVQIVYYFAKPDGTLVPLGVSDPVTLTAGTCTIGGKYVAPSYVFDGFGANVCRVRCSTAPSAGTVDLWAGSF